MGDIKPKRNSPTGPEPNPIQDSALSEAPGESVVMPDIPGWNAEAPEPTPPPKGYFPPVDLIGAWQRVSAPPPPPAAAQGQAAQPGAEQPTEGQPFPVSNRLLVVLTGLGVAVVAGLGGTYYFFFRPEPAPAPQPVAVTTPRPSVKPSPRPTFQPSPRPVPAPPSQPAPSQPGPRTYTVVPGDTLITIGERLGIDWRQIAAANGQIADPNLILPGQVLKIP